MTAQEIYKQLVDGKRVKLALTDSDEMESIKVQVYRLKANEEAEMAKLGYEIGTEKLQLSITLVDSNTWVFQFKDKKPPKDYKVISVE
jgi:hypothetical protein